MVHGPLFALLTIVLIHFANRWRTVYAVRFSLPRAIFVGLLLFGFGVAMEFAQAISGRSSSIVDAISNGLGIISGGCLSYANARRLQSPGDRRTARLLQGFAGFLIAIVWWSPVLTVRDVIAMKRDFPLLASFESPAELERWYFNDSIATRSALNSTHGDHSLKVTFGTSDHPSATMIDFPHDWTGVESIEVDVTLDSSHPETTAEIWFNVIDADSSDDYRDTARKGFTLHRDKTSRLVVSREELSPPAVARDLKLDQIRFVELQVLKPPVPITIRFDFLRLKL